MNKSRHPEQSRQAKAQVVALMNQGTSWQEAIAGAGSLLLLAAAHETGLISSLCTAVSPSVSSQPSRLTTMRRSSLEMLILTLLFLAVAGLRRTWDLRSYTGESLALLSGRKHS